MGLIFMGANKRMYFSGSLQLCGNRLAVKYFRPRGSFSANFCPLFTAFLQPEIQSAIDRSLPTPPINLKHFGLHPVSIACLQLEIDTGEN